MSTIILNETQALGLFRGVAEANSGKDAIMQLF